MTVIVAGVDGTETSLAAAVWAAGEARRHGADLELVHVYPVLAMAGEAAAAISQLGDYNRQAAENVLTAAAEQVRAAHPEVTVTCHAVSGSPGVSLRDQSAHALMTVLSRTSRPQFAQTLLGSTTTRVAEHNDVPTVVVGPDRPDSGPVLVAVEPGADPVETPVLEFAFAEAQLRKVPLIAARVWDDRQLNTYGLVYGLLLDPAAVDAAEAQALSLQLEPWLDKFPDVNVQQVVLRGAVAEALLDFAANRVPALLVSGTRGRSGVAGMLLGSVSRKLLSHAPCPVAVVPGS